LYRALAAPGNLCVAPYSLEAVLWMAREGARGETAAEMAAVLGPSRPADMRDSALRTANAVWLQRGLAITAEYRAALETEYHALLGQADFAAAEDACREINQWVAAQTNGKIQQLVTPRNIHPALLMVLANAVHFKAAWASPFEESDTRPERFFPESGPPLDTPMMRQEGSFRYREGGGLQMIEMPFAGRVFSLLVLLPDKGTPLQDLEAQLDAARLERWSAELRPERVDLSLPRFRMESSLELTGTLQGLGMRQACRADQADFSGITGGRDVFIGLVVQKTYFDVNEAGAEAAAATAAMMVAAAMMQAPPKPKVFRADRPFLFALRAPKSGTLLFLGRVACP
jgi:serpin B